MDDFVCWKLNAWGLEEYIETFKKEKVDEESLYFLTKEHIKELIPVVGHRAKFERNLELLKEEVKANVEASSKIQLEEGAAMDPVTPSTSQKRRNSMDSPIYFGNSPTKLVRHSKPDDISSILLPVKSMIKTVNTRLKQQKPTKLNSLLRTKIKKLEKDKKELVAVFGRTGTGKSSLLNAIIEEEDLLPTGDITACTSVVVQVQASTSSSYEAEIEFIKKKEWSDEYWIYDQFCKDKSAAAAAADAADAADDDDDDDDIKEKLSALYGDELKSSHDLFNDKFFNQIPEFLCEIPKKISCKTVKELSTELIKFTRTEPEDDDCKGKKRWYWPLVKSVTVKVPNNDLLQHVTFVDLPGNGDRNKSRDEMWKKIVGRCAVVWIVSDMNRPADDKEAWEILERASGLMGNGGECQQIHFICNKCDIKSKDFLNAPKRAKDRVTKQFNNLVKTKKHFREECFKVFTVSATDSLGEKLLHPDHNEMSKLKTSLENLLDFNSAASNYVSEAHGILALIQGARSEEARDKKAEVCSELEKVIRNECERVKESVEKAYNKLESCLDDGVQKSKDSCVQILRSAITVGKKGGRFHKTLKRVVEKDGVHTTQKGKKIDLNMILSSCLTDSIDENFRNTFPNERKRGAFDNAIKMLSFGTEQLTEKYKDVALQLIFLQTEETAMKTKLDETIRDLKKTIYHSLAKTIQTKMLESYKEAREFEGKNTLQNMRATLERHVEALKDTMFDEAKREMLTQLNDLKEEILTEIKIKFMDTAARSLTEDPSLPDVSVEFEEVTELYNNLRRNSDEDY